MRRLRNLEQRKGRLKNINCRKLKFLCGIWIMKNKLSFFIVFSFFTAAVGCQSSQNQTKSNAAAVQIASPSPQMLDIDFEKLTSKSNFTDVAQVIGNPDKSAASGPPNAQIPNIALFYKAKNIIVFLGFDSPFKGKYDAAKSHYIGAKALDPEKVLHVADEKYRKFVDEYDPNLVK